MAQAAAGLDAPCALLDLDAFDENADALVRRAGGRPIRVASKSLRCRPLIERVLARDGFSGVMSYAVREAIWLVRCGIRDVFVAYPSADRSALAEVAADPELRAQITVTIDSAETAAFLAEAVGPGSGVRVALDVDASLRLGPMHLGARRSPLRTVEQALAAQRACAAAGLSVVGVMFYDAQVAGIPDGGPLVRLVKARSLAELAVRRRVIVQALRGVTELEFVNVGGTGSVDRFGPAGASGVTRASGATGPEADVITEVAAGSGLYGSHLFDLYHRFTPRPALQFAFPVVRRPDSRHVTVFSGGYVASGVPGPSRLPRPVDRGLKLLGSEGAGEVQTPLRGPRAAELAIGDWVLMRPAKAGEPLERFDTVHLVSGGRVVGQVPTYRGEGRNFG